MWESDEDDGCIWTEVFEADVSGDRHVRGGLTYKRQHFWGDTDREVYLVHGCTAV